MRKWIKAAAYFARKLVMNMRNHESTDEIWGEITTWSVANSPRRHGGGGGGGATSMLTNLFIGLILIFVGLYFVATFAPILGNITSVDGIVGTFLDLAIWIIPLLAIVGLIVYGVRSFFGGKGR
jgi:hypothetical protein